MTTNTTNNNNSSSNNDNSNPHSSSGLSGGGGSFVVRLIARSTKKPTITSLNIQPEFMPDMLLDTFQLPPNYWQQSYIDPLQIQTNPDQQWQQQNSNTPMSNAVLSEFSSPATTSANYSKPKNNVVDVNSQEQIKQTSKEQQQKANNSKNTNNNDSFSFVDKAVLDESLAPSTPLSSVYSKPQQNIVDDVILQESQKPSKPHKINNHNHNNNSLVAEKVGSVLQVESVEKPSSSLSNGLSAAVSAQQRAVKDDSSKPILQNNNDDGLMHLSSKTHQPSLNSDKNQLPPLPTPTTVAKSLSSSKEVNVKTNDLSPQVLSPTLRQEPSLSAKETLLTNNQQEKIISVEHFSEEARVTTTTVVGREPKSLNTDSNITENKPALTPTPQVNEQNPPTSSHLPLEPNKNLTPTLFIEKIDKHNPSVFGSSFEESKNSTPQSNFNTQTTKKEETQEKNIDKTNSNSSGVQEIIQFKAQPLNPTKTNNNNTTTMSTAQTATEELPAVVTVREPKEIETIKNTLYKINSTNNKPTSTTTHTTITNGAVVQPAVVTNNSNPLPPLLLHSNNENNNKYDDFKDATTTHQQQPSMGDSSTVNFKQTFENSLNLETKPNPLTNDGLINNINTLQPDQTNHNSLTPQTQKAYQSVAPIDIPNLIQTTVPFDNSPPITPYNTIPPTTDQTQLNNNVNMLSPNYSSPYIEKQVNPTTPTTNNATPTTATLSSVDYVGNQPTNTTQPTSTPTTTTAVTTQESSLVTSKILPKKPPPTITPLTPDLTKTNTNNDNNNRGGEGINNSGNWEGGLFVKANQLKPLPPKEVTFSKDSYSSSSGVGSTKEVETTVTIHIGRIEVHAVRAPEPRPANLPRAPVLSLSEYLKQESERNY